MAKVELECPSCGGTVELGDITCRHCGVNLKSGESYEKQVKRAKGREKKVTAPAGALYIGVLLAFGLVTLSGLMWQKRMEAAIAQRPDLFYEPVPLEDGSWGESAFQRLQRVQDLVDAGKHEEARTVAEALIAWIDEEAEQLYIVRAGDIETRRHYRRDRRQDEDDDSVAIKRMLLTLKAKAQEKIGETTGS
jgi:hypothetical protein